MPERHSTRVSLAQDEMLIERLRGGDKTAYGQLVYKYANYVASIAYNIVGDAHIASDMAQETFLKMYQKINDLDNPKRFKAWLFSIVRSTCIDWLRKEHIRPCSLDKIQDEGIEPTDLKKSKTASVELEELREKVLNIIGCLPKIYRQIVLLKHLRHMSYKEMSEFLGIPVATIESRLYRARLMLKDRLEDLYI